MLGTALGVAPCGRGLDGDMPVRPAGGGFRMTFWFDNAFLAGCSGTNDDCELVGASYGEVCEISGSQ